MIRTGAGPEPGTSRWLEALEWYTALCEADAAALTSNRLRAWQQWYGQPDNQRVFDQLSQLLADNPPCPERLWPSANDLEADRYDPSLTVREWRRAQRIEAANHRPPAAAAAAPKRRWATVSMASLLAAAAIAGLLLVRPSWLPKIGAGARPLVYQTGTEELTKVRLPDGSTVTLGGHTRVYVNYTARRRSVQLSYGEGWFHDRDIRGWPFVVSAGGGTITAIGTEFVVSRGPDHVVVMVTAGTVEVAARARPPVMLALGQTPVPVQPLPVVRLQRDQQLSYGDDGTVGLITRSDPRSVAAWTQGLLVFDDMPLRDVVGNVDRYWSRHIAVSGPAGRLRFSGVVYEHRVRDWLDGLSRIFPVDVDATGASICVRTRNNRPSQPRSACAVPRVPPG